MTASARIVARLIVVLLTIMGVNTQRQVWAEEPTTIQQILEEPQVYHLRHVVLRGIVREVQPLAPYTLANGDNCYGAYLFRLEDDEATIPIAVLGICGRPLVRDPEVDDGDRVEVSATIQAPSHGGYYLSFKGLKMATEQDGIVQAVADRILPIIE
ncbi:MAG TPA: hypothetical protein VLE46_01370 [Nitrospira sp.]|jgi:hypothetical protein|nr:hypothetical protein [Nitrospira sp.]